VPTIFLFLEEIMLSQFFVFLLLLDAANVAYGLFKKRNMWVWIVVYWTILTCKNLVDLIGVP